MTNSTTMTKRPTVIAAMIAAFASVLLALTCAAAPAHAAQYTGGTVAPQYWDDDRWDDDRWDDDRWDDDRWDDDDDDWDDDDYYERARMNTSKTTKATKSAYRTDGGVADMAVGQTFKVNGNTYRITDYEPYDDDMGEVMLVKYASSAKAASIDTVTYNGHKFEVDTIGKNAFNNSKGHKVTSVTLGRHVDRILAKAFYGCKKVKTFNMAKSDVVDIERSYQGFYIDEVKIGSKAFKNAGVKGVKVKCGSSNAEYKALYKQALRGVGLRSNAKIVR